MSQNQLEIEVKVRCETNPLVARPEFNIQELAARHFEDNWLLDGADRRVIATGAVLRLRTASGRGWLTWKGPVQEHPTLKIRKEIEVEIADPASLLGILKALGFKTVFRYQKYRTVYRIQLPAGQTLTAMYDETPIGSFLELEGEEAPILSALQLLGAGREQTTKASYAGLYRAYCKQHNLPFGDMTFESVPARRAM